MIGAASPIKTENNMLTELPVVFDNKNKTVVNWRGMLRGSSNHYLRSERPNLFYPLFIEKGTNKVTRIGNVLSSDMSVDSIFIDANETMILPINQKGEESTWNLGVEKCKEYLNKGYIRISNGKTPQYLNKGILDEIANGQITVSGRDKENNNSLLLTRELSKTVSARTIWY